MLHDGRDYRVVEWVHRLHDQDPGVPASTPSNSASILAHLADVAGTVAAFTTQLSTAGRLLVDEIEWIHTAHPVFVAYEQIVVDLRDLAESTGADDITWGVRQAVFERA